MPKIAIDKPGTIIKKETYVYDFEYPLLIKKKSVGLIYNSSKFVLFLLINIFLIEETYNFFSYAIEDRFNKYILVIFYLILTEIISFYVLLLLLPELLIYITDGTPFLEINNDGVMDHTVSPDIMLWEYFSSIKIIRSPMMGTSSIRLEINKKSNIKFRSFRIDRIYQKYFLPLRNKYVFISIKGFEENAVTIGAVIEYTFKKSKS
ncbi:hypothetical protein NAC44_21060 [Allorhizobium sp. BGMRC 0089]|uniref:hypothetical protein n=1 Tax=Allorhizobium sonneratiae TaxID=2934936 RepID=UPI002034589C|nr:hypothetical protein [Allorhizobium sonneratiae]MCM2294813.1 hypothetical protein [Allorhizobium sonneratiae]